MATDDITVREARPEDDAAIGDILVAGFTAGYQRKIPEYAVMSPERERELRDVAAKRKRATVLVAERAGRVVGTATLVRPGAPGSEAWLPNAADLRHMAVDPSLHGQGISGPLLDGIEALARSWGVDAICCHVRARAVGVMAIYERRGYARAPEGDLRRGDVILDAFVLKLRA